jgi:hypothetical protein
MYKQFFLKIKMTFIESVILIFNHPAGSHSTRGFTVIAILMNQIFLLQEKTQKKEYGKFLSRRATFLYSLHLSLMSCYTDF